MLQPDSIVRRSRTKQWLIGAVMAAGIVGAVGLGRGQPAGGDAAKARLITERTHFVPGEEAWLGVSFEIKPRWHLYWNGLNDSGGPPEVNLTLPEGYTAGKTVWPAPKRHVLGKEILDHVYEERVTLLIPVRVPESAKAGETAKIRADLKWMVCEDVCLLGGDTVSVGVPVGDAGRVKPSADIRLFEEARARVPRPPPKENSPFTLEWKDGAAVITAPGAQRVSFYPGVESAGFESFLRDGEAKGERVVLRTNPFTDGPVRLVGVLEITRPKPAPPSIFALSSEPPPGAGHAPAGGPGNPGGG